MLASRNLVAHVVSTIVVIIAINRGGSAFSCVVAVVVRARVSIVAGHRGVGTRSARRVASIICTSSPIVAILLLVATLARSVIAAVYGARVVVITLHRCVHASLGRTNALHVLASARGTRTILVSTTRSLIATIDGANVAVVAIHGVVLAAINGVARVNSTRIGVIAADLLVDASCSLVARVFGTYVAVIAHFGGVSTILGRIASSRIANRSRAGLRGESAASGR